MRRSGWVAAGWLLAVAVASGQQPGQDANGFVARMMAFDANHDGKLTRSEITDQRLAGLFDRADANGDGVVTGDELRAWYAKENAGFGGGGDGPRGGPGGGPGSGPRGFGGPDMRPQPGQILPEGMQRMLQLTPEQKASVAALQREVDAKLAKLLTAEQKAQLKDVAQRGPGGGPRGGPPPGER